MMTRVTQILVGKDITRTATITSIYDGTNLPADGEILVLDKNKEVLAAGSTIADSDIIYLCQGTGTTYSYTNDAGTVVSGARKLIFSDPIEGAKVRRYAGTAYTAKSEQVTTFQAITSPLTAGTEYVLRIVYKDVNAKRGQFSKTYRFVATGTTSEAVFNGLRAAIAADKGARIVGSGTTTLILTGKEIPECSSALTDIDKFSMVEFDAFLNYVDSDGYQQACTLASATVTTKAEYGFGTWELVRDAEKDTMGYQGIMDQTSFPVIAPALRAVVDETYDTIVIEHDRTYLSPDNQYVKQAPMTTVVYIPYTATSNQMTDVLAVLNPWMASTPAALPNVTF
ncbi:MAG: hypothetical protein WC346_12945 [Methanogenium sp.]|jgi:hypothetical protein